MKKVHTIFILMILCLSVPVSAADRLDLVVLLDNSISVIPHYPELQDALLKKIVKEHLKPGDTFNLISFSDNPDIEIAREIKNSADIDSILAYVSLLQPMGKYTDLVMALRFLYTYTLDLPLSNKKKIIIVTDGIHDPPHDSPYFASETAVRKAAERVSADIKREGWDVGVVLIEDPPEEAAGTTDGTVEAPGSEGTKQAISQEPTEKETVGPEKTEQPVQITPVDITPDLKKGLDPSPAVLNGEDSMASRALKIPELSFSTDLGDISRTFNFPVMISNNSSAQAVYSLSEILYRGQNILKDPVTAKVDGYGVGKLNPRLILPASVSNGPNTIELEFIFTGGIRTNPSSAVIDFNLVSGGSSLPLWPFLLAAGAALAALIILLAAKAATSPRNTASPGNSSDTGTAATAARTDSTPSESGKTATDAGKDKVQDNIITDGSPAASDVTKSEDKEAHTTIPLIPADSDEFSALLLPSSGLRHRFQDFVHKKNRPIEMLVYGQNTKNGVSNVKWLGKNIKRTVGGAHSSTFRIFFVNVPKLIATIHFNGTDFIFKPAPGAESFFPEIDEELPSCLYKPILISTPEGHSFFIEFRQWISKLEKLNRIMTLTRHPGKPDMEF